MVDECVIAKAVALRKQGKTQEEIAVELGVVQGTVSIILRKSGLSGRLVAVSRPRRRS